MIETFKIVHGLNNVDSTLNFILSHSILTRGHRFKLFHITCIMIFGNIFLLNRIVSLSNGLPNYVSAITVNSFKNRLDKHWLRQDFKFDCKAKKPDMGN
jgi:hypothetical protein